MEKESHRCVCEVAFADTDASGLVHFTKVLGYVERAEHGLLKKLGLMVFEKDTVGWPRVRVSCDYRKPMRFGDVVEVVLGLMSVGGRSAHWCFEVKRGDELCAEGEMVCVRVDGSGKAVEFSEEERERLEGLLF